MAHAGAGVIAEASLAGGALQAVLLFATARRELLALELM
jgi:hypothetical protein